MANNRIYLRCTRCGETLYLGKRFNGEYFWERYHDDSLESLLNRFYEDHAFCREHRKDKADYPYSLDDFPLPDLDKVHYLDCFDIVYELDEEEKNHD